MFERKLYHHIDWALVVAIVALCALGLVMIYSTTSDPTSTRAASRMHMTQLYAKEEFRRKDLLEHIRNGLTDAETLLQKEMGSVWMIQADLST